VAAGLTRIQLVDNALKRIRSQVANAHSWSLARSSGCCTLPTIVSIIVEREFFELQRFKTFSSITREGLPQVIAAGR
jgi:hypothetical protein